MHLLTGTEFSTKYTIKISAICQEGKENNVVTFSYNCFFGCFAPQQMIDQ